MWRKWFKNKTQHQSGTDCLAIKSFYIQSEQRLVIPKYQMLSKHFRSGTRDLILLVYAENKSKIKNQNLVQISRKKYRQGIYLNQLTCDFRMMGIFSAMTVLLINVFLFFALRKTGTHINRLIVNRDAFGNFFRRHLKI